ncbi:hypothetical protein RND81_11G179900 [Saponaria officinalis]|uniref:Uncharacterized protein n=1 Tax=Saponaria officinalis TaxID=3572 RepID=A0AAW1HQ62_SAPOF
MSMTISTIISPKIWRNYPHSPSIITTPTLVNSPTKTPFLNLHFHRSPPKLLTKSSFVFSGAKLEFIPKAKNGERTGSIGDERELEELRGESTMPDRFKYLTKEAPSSPILWPWFLALGFLIYAWRTVLWELSNWQKVVMAMFGFVGYLSKLALAIVFHFIGDQIMQTILYIEIAVNVIRDFCLSIVTSAPIPELTIIFILASTVLAIGEAASPNSVNSQPYALTVAALIGYGAVEGVIIEPFFWFFLFGIFAFSRLFKKRDYVSSALPVATVLASVGEPWVRALAVVLFTALAIHHHSKKLADAEADQVKPSSVKIPFPLLAIALAIGIRAAAYWAGYRHLTWMVA